MFCCANGFVLLLVLAAVFEGRPSMDQMPTARAVVLLVVEALGPWSRPLQHSAAQHRTPVRTKRRMKTVQNMQLPVMSFCTWVMTSYWHSVQTTS